MAMAQALPNVFFGRLWYGFIRPRTGLQPHRASLMAAMASSVFELFEQISSSFSSLNEEDSDRDEHDDTSIEGLAEMLRTVNLDIGMIAPPWDHLPPIPLVTAERASRSLTFCARERRRSSSRSSAPSTKKKRGLQRGPVPILKTRIPRDLQAVFLASQRGETVHEPPRSGAAFREFKRVKSRKGVVFNNAQLPPLESRMPDTPQRRSCRWGSQVPSDPKAAAPRQPDRPAWVGFTFLPPLSPSSEASPALPKRSASPARAPSREPIRNLEEVERSTTNECCRETAATGPADSTTLSLRCSIQCLMTGTARRCALTRRNLQPQIPRRSRSPECPAGRNSEVGSSTAQ
jgi:hypothetical protein